LNDLAVKTRDRKVSMDELQVGRLTISTGGIGGRIQADHQSSEVPILALAVVMKRWCVMED